MEDNKTMMSEAGKHPAGCQCAACKMGSGKGCGCGGNCAGKASGGCGSCNHGKMAWCWVVGFVVFLLIIVLVFFAGLRIGAYQGYRYGNGMLRTRDGFGDYGRPMMGGSPQNWAPTVSPTTTAASSTK